MLIEELIAFLKIFTFVRQLSLAVHVEYHSLVWTPVTVHVDCQVVDHNVEQVNHDIVRSVLGVLGKLRLATMQSMLWHTLEAND